MKKLKDIEWIAVFIEMQTKNANKVEDPKGKIQALNMIIDNYKLLTNELLWTK